MSEWTKRSGYEVTPSEEDRRDVVNTPFNISPVDPTKPSQPPVVDVLEETVEEGIQEDHFSESTLEPSKEVKETLVRSEREEGTSQLTPVTVLWQGCRFKVKFDKVLVHKSEINEWLILAHNLSREPDGPPWSPPVSEKPQTFEIEIHLEEGDTRHTVTYLDLSLRWDQYILYVFLIS